jgi:putative aminopeptidase FrvX
MELLKKLTRVQSVSSNEGQIADFIVTYVLANQNKWQCLPKIYTGDAFQDNVVLVFGEKPKTAVYAHTDTIGYILGYDNELTQVGGVPYVAGTMLVGQDSHGLVSGKTALLEEMQGEKKKSTCIFDSERTVEVGTMLSYAPIFEEEQNMIHANYLDNRVGIYLALKLAETMQNGALVFSTYEEHNGGSVGFLADFLWKNHGVRQALIADITWESAHIQLGAGAVVSLRDASIPRRKFLNQILDFAKESGIPFQKEIEKSGGSDGSYLQKSNVPVDWCFVGVPNRNTHKRPESINKNDLDNCLKLYRYLLNNL